MYKERTDEHPPKFKRKNDQPDEIDLREIFSYFKSGIDGLVNSIKRLFLLIFNNKAILSLFVLIGMLLAYGAYYITKPYYTSSMTLMLSDIRNEFVEDQLEKLTLMIEDDNFEAVSESLDISENSARQIKKMTFSNLDQNRIAEDSILRGSPFMIEVSLYDNRLFNSMEPAITNYLENNRYFSKQKRIRQRQVESVISKLRGEISSIDSLKTAVASPRGPVNGFVYGEALDPTNLYRESLGMYKEQASLEAELEQLDNIQVVTGFSPRSKPTGPKLLMHLLIGGGLFFFVGLIFILQKDKA